LLLLLLSPIPCHVYLHPEPAFGWIFRAPATHTNREKAVTEPEKPFSIRQATREDGAGLIKLIVALAEFEKLTPPDPEARERLLDDGFGARSKFETLLAFWETNAEPVGYAVFFETYSTFLARPGLFLEDLFVLPAYRKRGIGAALLKRCIALADQRGCGRMEWTCLDWNTNAQYVYEKLGARRLSDWYLYRLGRDRIEHIAREDR
jgi:GNAT superfamily N-acetyltransferase